MTRTWWSLAWPVIWGSLAAAACASKHQDPPPAVIDLHASCTQRAGWARLATVECSNCNARASLNCNCTHVGYEGLCETEDKAKAAEPDCSPDLSFCVGACGSDCVCQDNCYVNHAKCRAVTTDLNSCLARVCDSYCK